MGRNDPFENALMQLNKISRIVNLDEDNLKILKSPERVLEVFIPVEMDNGSTQVFNGYRSQHSTVLGPAKGGIRYHPGVTESEVKALSMWMSWKCSVAGLPLGGGKGGIIVDPKELSKTELEKLSRGYVRAVFPIIGPQKDIPAPDVNTDGQIMSWMADEYNKIAGREEWAAFTGKPVENHGSNGREAATGLGGYYILESMQNEFKLDKSKISVAVQGFGNVGSFFAKFAYDNNYMVVAVSDSKGGIYNEHGLNVHKLTIHKKDTGKVMNFSGGINISNEELLQLNVDVLVPSALENAITSDNASKIKSRYIIELANGPVTPEADEILDKNNIVVIPDVLANSGGVTVSFFEYLQNLNNEEWTELEVNNKLKPIIQGAFNDTVEKSREYHTSLRMGAYARAIKRIVEEMSQHGRVYTKLDKG